MKMSDKATEVAEAILARFERGDIGPALAQVFVKTGVPHEEYSPLNRFWLALCGATDARTYRQWQAVGRQVRKGEKSISLLKPYMSRWTEEGEDGAEEKRFKVNGYGTFAVFDTSQTDGSPVAYPDVPKVEELPLIEAAEALGVFVNYANVKGTGALGWYSRRTGSIVLGVEGLRVWLHELAHAADHANATLVEKANSPLSEIVADLSAVVLAHMAGRPEEADEGSVYKYLLRQAQRENKDLFILCRQVLNRVAAVVETIMSHATEREEVGVC